MPTAKYYEAIKNRRTSNQYMKASETGKPKPDVSVEAKARLAQRNKDRVWTPEQRTAVSLKAKERGLGGHTSKTQMYFQKRNGDELYLQSSYEIRFAEILESLRVDWIRPNPLTWTDVVGIEHRYYPDFKVGDIYFDTKNDYLAVKDLPKINAVREQNLIDLRIVTKNQINEEYVLDCLSGR